MIRLPPPLPLFPPPDPMLNPPEPPADGAPPMGAAAGWPYPNPPAGAAGAPN